MSLKQEIAGRIMSNGPISVADYMTECLLHPSFGYYTTHDPFGAEGDFVTAPEVSQMFGELIGLCMAQAWIDQGHREIFTICELGPGRGTLMADIMRATKNVPGFQEAARIFLVEASPRLQDVQRNALEQYNPCFVPSVNELPDQSVFFVGNEFFDALPVRQFVRAGSSWRERQVGLDEPDLIFGLGPETPQPMLSHRLDDTKDGDVVEYCPSAKPIVETLGQRITAHGGMGLVIDYGDWRSLGNTLQAVQAHRRIDVLEDPGCSDLTAHVDFEVLALSAPCKHTRLTPQGAFLERLGLTPRAQALAKSLTGSALETHILAHRRLTHPEEMGNLFKVLGFFPDGCSPPAGLNV